MEKENMSKDQSNNDMCCGHRGCMHGGHAHFLFHVLLALVILSITFMMGLKLGEIKGAYGGYDGYGMMGRYGTIMMRGGADANAFYNTFQGGSGTSTATPAVPATPKK